MQMHLLHVTFLHDKIYYKKKAAHKKEREHQTAKPNAK